MSSSRVPSLRAPQSIDKTKLTAWLRDGLRAVEGRLRLLPFSWRQAHTHSEGAEVKEEQVTARTLNFNSTWSSPRPKWTAATSTPGKNPLLLQHCIAVTCSTF